MLMIRLQRIGRKNDPAFRILVLEKTRSPKAGTYTDLLGTYNPKTKAFTVSGERVKEWIAKGAQVSPSLMNLFIDKGVLEGKKVSVIAKATLEKNVAKRAEEAAAADAAKVAAEEAAKAQASAPVAEEPTSEAVEEAAIAEADDASSDAEASPAPAVEEAPATEAAAPEEAAA